jgi:hypothetical protein
MLIEQRTYTLHSHCTVADYLEPYRSMGLPLQQKHLGGFLGFFTSEFGVQNRLVHQWAYSDLEDRRTRRATLAQEPEWQRCLTLIRPMIASIENLILYPTEFSPIRTLPVRSSEKNTAFTWTTDAH